MTPEELEEAKNCWEAQRELLIKDGNEALANQFEAAVKTFGVDFIMPIIEDNDLYRNAPQEAKDLMVKGLKYLEWISKVN